MDFEDFNWDSLEPGRNLYITINNNKITSYYSNWSLVSYFKINKIIIIYLDIDGNSIDCENHNRVIHYCKNNNFGLVQKINTQ